MQQRVSNPLHDNVLLVIVTLGSDDDSSTEGAGINHAIAHLLQTYQSEYGTELIQYHVSTPRNKKFSRGASKYFKITFRPSVFHIVPLAGCRDDVDILVFSQ